MDVRTPRKQSPYSLIQEQLRGDEWKLFVACSMLNLTTAVQVKQIIWEFFRRWPTASDCVSADPDEIRELIRPLGLYNRRTRTLQRLSRSFRDGSYKSIRDIPGVGQYAADSHRIFCEGILIENANDIVLQTYLKWAKNYVKVNKKPRTRQTTTQQNSAGQRREVPSSDR